MHAEVVVTLVRVKTCSAWLGHDGRHWDSLNDGGALLRGGRRDPADVEDSGLVSCASCLGSGDDGGGFAICGGHQLQDGAGWEGTFCLEKRG